MQIINKALPPPLVCMGGDVICASVFDNNIVFSIADLKAGGEGVYQRIEMT